MAKMVLGVLFNRTVLIVANDAKTRETLAGAFQSFRCSVLIAENESAAIKLVETNPQIEVVLIEVNSPIASAFQFVDQIRGRDDERPPVFIVSDKKDEFFDEAFFHGVEAIFLKPIHFDELVKGVAFSYGILMDHSDRLHRRRRIRRAKVQYSLESTGAVSSGYATNISQGGVFIASVTTLPAVNQTINFKLQYESEKLIEVSGRAVVRWLRPIAEYGRPPGFGVEFLNLDAQAAESVRLLSAHHPPPPNNGPNNG